ncbi:Dephospho-CoA kinase domain-containing protein, partial [Tetrabaena socialis]
RVMRLVGLSGGIASGKSTVARELAALDFDVIDCDELAKKATLKGSWGWRRVVASFGDGVLAADGELDRECLGHLVFNDASARRRLNSATHLPVALALARRLLTCWLSCKWIVVVDMPLLFETKVYKLTRPNVLVACSQGTQLSRLVHRDGGSTERAVARINSQMPLDAKRRLADVVIENEGGLEQLRDQVRQLAARLRRGARAWGLLTSPLMALALVLLPFWRWR